MTPRADVAALNVQPRQRRTVYEELAKVPEGKSAKDLVREMDMPEADLRETLRMLDAAGLAQRVKGVWRAVPLETSEPETSSKPEADAAAPLDS
jgi:hypothetical protein